MVVTPLDPTKFHVLSKGQRMLAIGLGLLFCGTLGPAILFGYYKAAVVRPAQTDKETKFVITEGETAEQIIDGLANDNLINSKFLFKFYSKINGFENNLQAGTYIVPAGTAIPELAQLLQHGTNDKTITFIEGWRVEEFAKKAADNFEKIDYDEFISLAKPAEGTIFPDTYSFNTNVTEEELFTTLQTTFTQKTKDLLTPEALSKVGLDKTKAIILASIVEREGQKTEDRRLIAGILLNRLRENQVLGADATVQYLAGPARAGCDILAFEGLYTPCPTGESSRNLTWWPQDLTVAELDYDSPFNTRKNAGLPPTPICNPGLSALNAVLDPMPSEYYYYLHDKTGKTHFAKTLAEHAENIKAYLAD